MIIGLTGKAGCGKDTAASIVASMLGAQRVAFADPLRDMLAAIGITTRRMTDRALKEEPIPWLNNRSARYMLQTLGTEWGRTLVDPDIWVKLAMQRCEGHEHTVFTDVRFDNEARAIGDAGGIIILIERGSAQPVESHVSEAGLPMHLVSVVIQNNGSVGDLERELSAIIKMYRNDRRAQP